MHRLKPALTLLLTLLLAGCSIPSGNRQVLWDWEAAEALRLALTKVGCPYVSAAQGPYSFDCSGLVLWSYQQAYPALHLRDDDGGIVYHATADVLWRLNVRRIDLRSARPGDLVFLSWDASRVTHVGLFRRWPGEPRLAQNLPQAPTAPELARGSLSSARLFLSAYPLRHPLPALIG